MTTRWLTAEERHPDTQQEKKKCFAIVGVQKEISLMAPKVEVITEDLPGPKPQILLC